MSDTSKIEYSTRGRRWSRGWNRYEAPTMNRLIGLLISIMVIGAIAGLLLGLWLALSLGMVILLMLGTGIIALFVSIGIAKAVIPLIWDVILTRDLEKKP